MVQFKQEKPYYCGPASLQLVQHLLGRSKTCFTQSEWAYLAGTKASGTSVVGMKRCINKIARGFRIVHRSLSLSAWGAIVYDPDRDHWVVVKTWVYGMTPVECAMYAVYDPEDGSSVLCDNTELLERFKRRGKFYALEILP